MKGIIQTIQDENKNRQYATYSPLTYDKFREAIASFFKHGTDEPHEEPDTLLPDNWTYINLRDNPSYAIYWS